MVCKFTCKPDPDCFQTLRLSACPGQCSITYPVHPAIGLYVRLIFDATVVAAPRIDADRFEPLCLSGRSAYASILRPFGFPAVCLPVYPVIDACCLIYCVLRYDLNFNLFQSLCFSCRSSECSVIYPALIVTVSLDMHLIPDIIVLCQLSGQPHLDCFQSLSLSGRSCWLSGIYPVCPAVCLPVYPVLDRSCIS